MAVRSHPKLEREAADPATSPDRLVVLSRRKETSIASAAQSNPSLPFEELKAQLSAGSAHAWVNPSTILLQFSGGWNDDWAAWRTLRASILDGQDVGLPGLWDAISPSIQRKLDDPRDGAWDSIRLLLHIDAAHVAQQLGNEEGSTRSTSEKILVRVAIEMLRAVGCVWNRFMPIVYRALDILDNANESDDPYVIREARSQAQALLYPPPDKAWLPSACGKMNTQPLVLAQSFRKAVDVMNMVHVSNIDDHNGVNMKKRGDEIIRELIPWSIVNGLIEEFIVSSNMRVDRGASTTS